jgi:L-amino acid N-acyltransferase YncA
MILLVTTILLPTHKHINQIRQLNYKYLIDNLTDIQKQNGFVRIAYESENLMEIINNKEIVIALDNNVVVGYYLIGKTSEIPTLNYQKNKAIYLCENHNIPFDSIGYGCQVCIDEEYRNKGLFKSMIENLSAIVGNKYSHLLCSISEDNNVSLKSHTNNGWQLIDSLEKTKFLIYQTNNPTL